MPNNRLPVDKASALGADIKNPGRHKSRSKPKGVRPLGNPYVKMNDAEISQWEEFARDLPWLNSSHRVLLRMACKLTVDMDGVEFGVSKAQALSSILSKLGATPVDESKVARPDDDDEPDDIFDN